MRGARVTTPKLGDLRRRDNGRWRMVATRTTLPSTPEDGEWTCPSSVDLKAMRREWARAFADRGYELLDVFQSWDVDGEPRADEWLVLRKRRCSKKKPELLYARVTDKKSLTDPCEWDVVSSFERQWTRETSKQQRILDRARQFRTASSAR